MIAALHIDWFRAAADIAGAFACAYVGQWWGYRRGKVDAWFEIEAEAMAEVRKMAQGHTPDRQDERIAL